MCEAARRRGGEERKVRLSPCRLAASPPRRLRTIAAERGCAMDALVNERCEVCRKDSPRVTEAEIAELSPQIPEWKMVEVDGVPRLQRTFRFRSYPETLAFVQRVGELAEEEGHHPAMTVEWGKVRVSWWTDAIKWLNRNDFIMAAKTDALAAEESE